MGRRKGQFWEHVVELEDGFKCNFCQRKFAGGISRIKSHLSGIKCRGIDICENVPKDVQATALSEIGGHCKKPRYTLTSGNPQDNQTCADNLSKINEEDKSMVDKKLAKFIKLNNIPLDVVEAPSFADFVRSVAEFGPDYNLPSTLNLKTKLIPDIDIEVEAYLKDVKESWNKTGCTVMVDRFYNLFTVFASSTKGLVFVNLYDISECSSNLVDFVSSVIEDIGVDRVVQLITKYVDLSYKFEDLITRKYPRLILIPCVAHEIHTLLHYIYHEVLWLRDIIDDARLIVKFMYEDGTVLSMMKSYTNNRELKHHPCRNKFSHYQMLKSVFDNKDELLQFVTSTEWAALDHSDKERAEVVAGLVKSMEFWGRGREVLKTLEPIIQILRLVEDDRATCAYFYESMVMAKEAILQLCNSNIKKYARILEIFEEEANKVIHPIHAAAAFINPAYMFSKNFKADSKMMEGISFVLKTLVADGDKNDFMTEVQLYRNKISYLFTDMAMAMLETSHPWAWWDFFGDCLPVLRKYAMWILSQPCKCSCELKNTAFEVAHTKDLIREPPKIVDTLVFKTLNTMLMEKFKSAEAQFLEPVDLGNCNELPDYVDVYQMAEKVQRILKVTEDITEEEVVQVILEGEEKDDEVQIEWNLEWCYRRWSG